MKKTVKRTDKKKACDFGKEKGKVGCLQVCMVKMPLGVLSNVLTKLYMWVQVVQDWVQLQFKWGAAQGKCAV